MKSSSFDSEALSKKASKVRSLCFATFFLLGNYFALYGIMLADKALRESAVGSDKNSEKLLLSAKRWGLWGLIPSTIINAALICACFLLLWKLGLKDLYEAVSKIK